MGMLPEEATMQQVRGLHRQDQMVFKSLGSTREDTPFEIGRSMAAMAFLLVVSRQVHTLPHHIHQPVVPTTTRAKVDI